MNGEQYAGIERVVDILIGASSLFGYRARLALLKSRKMVEHMVSKTDVHTFDMRSRFDLLAYRRVAALARDHGCSMLHSHTVRSALIAAPAARLADIPWIHHVHSPALKDSSHWGRNCINFVAEWALIRRADHVITVSAELAEYVTTYYGVLPSRIRLARNGVRQLARQWLVNANGRKTVCVLGAFRPRKGIEVLISAADLLKERFSQLSFRLVGPFSEDSYEFDIRRQVSLHGLSDRIEFVGFTRDTQKELQSCDVFAFPSLYGEGMPMAVLEAMAAGCAIVGTHTPGVTELLENGAGLLVEPGDARALADAIALYLENPHLAERSRVLARQRQCEQFDEMKMCRSVYEVYDRAMEQGDKVTFPSA